MEKAIHDIKNVNSPVVTAWLLCVGEIKQMSIAGLPAIQEGFQWFKPGKAPILISKVIELKGWKSGDLVFMHSSNLPIVRLIFGSQVPIQEMNRIHPELTNMAIIWQREHEDR